MNTSIFLILLISILTSIVFTAIVYFTTKRKIEASVQRLVHEMQNLRYELNTKTAAIEFAAYEESIGIEEIVYDSRNNDMQTDFTGGCARAWDYVAHRFSDYNGTGSHRVKENILIINRTNTDGRYELHLNKYSFKKNKYEKIPADNSIATRKLRLSCEVKRGTASHILRFVFKGETTRNVLDEKDYVVFSPDWEKVNLVFSISTQEDSALRIDDLSVLKAPSQVQLRNIVLFEKKQE